MEKIVESNRIIAEFDGRLFNGHPISGFGDGTCNAMPEMKYHNSWDWLMPVVEKIEQLRRGDKSYDVVIGFGEYCGIVEYEGKGRKRAVQRWESSEPYSLKHENSIQEQGTKRPDTKIEAVYKSVVDFITHYTATYTTP